MAGPPAVELRPAGVADSATLVELLADDEPGMLRKRVAAPVAACYRDVLDAIRADPDTEIVVGETGGGSSTVCS